MRKIRIEGRRIGDGEPVFVVAEAGINHNGSLDMARRLVDSAADAGCDAVKFQKRSVRAMLAREAYEKPYANGGNSFGLTYGEHRERLELDGKDFADLQAYARTRGLVFFASPWDEESADFLERLEVPCYKIGSPDLTNLPLCRHIARKGKPVILSTGMSEMWEVEESVRAILALNSELVLMHCVSIYPAPPESLRLQCIQLLEGAFGTLVGYSGHELGSEASIAAVALGACAIEKHITLDKTLKGGDHRFSLEPEDLKQLVSGIRTVEKALAGFEKYLQEPEVPFRQKLGKSVTSCRPIREGETITRDMLTCKSPATGISPVLFDRLVGKRAAHDIDGDVVLRSGDVQLG